VSHMQYMELRVKPEILTSCMCIYIYIYMCVCVCVCYMSCVYID
jgi:hypothetical protein